MFGTGMQEKKRQKQQKKVESETEKRRNQLHQ
jgi:hypothetical protein